jgi:hypothetical protein
MRSVADQLHRDTVKRVLAMSVRERIALALMLGEADLERYMRATGAGREQARRQLNANRRAGRQPSCADDDGR